MRKLKFSYFDAAVLYSIPKPGGTVAEISRLYAFIERVAVPEDATVIGCLEKALAAGIVKTDSSGCYCVSDKWYNVIHQFDPNSPSEVHAMLKFEELLLSKEWDSIQ